MITAIVHPHVAMKLMIKVHEKQAERDKSWNVEGSFIDDGQMEVVITKKDATTHIRVNNSNELQIREPLTEQEIRSIISNE